MGTEEPTPVKPNSTYLWFGITRELWLTALVVILCVAFGEGVIVYHEPDIRSRCAAMLWALACLGGSSVLGIIFGVPRVSAEPARQDNFARPHRNDRLRANTNMEQISDWLTKLLVGAGLVELRSVPHHLYVAATFVAGGLGGPQADSTAFAAALIIYFSAEGFLGGYLATRMFFQIAFQHSDDLLCVEDNGDDSPATLPREPARQNAI